MKQNLKTYLTAINAAILGGIEVMKVYESDDFGTEIKADNSPVTLADKNSSDVIIKELQATSLPILCEEIPIPPFEERKKWKKLWLVDPLDGTKEFIKKTDNFCVNIALIENEKPVFGVIYVPITKKLFFGGEKKGTYKINNVENKLTEEEIISALKLDIPPEKDVKIIIGGCYNIDNNTIDTLKEHEILFSKRQYVSLPSAIKFCHIAEGKSDVYPRLYPCMEWDTAAGHSIVKTAGYNVFDINTGKELLYNKKELLNPYVIVK